MQTATASVNRIKRLFTLTEQPVGELTKADLIARGFDGTQWLGVAPAKGSNAERAGLFYRNLRGEFKLVVSLT